MPTPTYAEDSQQVKAVLARYDSATGLPVFMDEVTGLPADVTDRAGRLLGIEANSPAIKTALEIIDNFISGNRGLVTEDNSASIKTAIEAVNTALQSSGITQVQLAAIKTAVEVIDNCISGSKALVTEDSASAIKTAVEAANTLLQSTKTKTVSQLNDWTAVAQNTAVSSAVLDLGSKFSGILHLHAALDSTTAHTGTKFRVMVSSAASGDEDWNLAFEFVALVGTAKTGLIGNNPLTAGSTSITITAHTLTADGVVMVIKDGTIADSELVYKTSDTTNAITILDGTTNAHAQNTAVFDIAFSTNIQLPDGALRAKVVIDNTYNPTGSSCMYKLRATTQG